MHISDIFYVYNLANRDLIKANMVLLIRFAAGQSKSVKLLDRIRSIYGRTVHSLGYSKDSITRRRREDQQLAGSAG